MKNKLLYYLVPVIVVLLDFLYVKSNIESMNIIAFSILTIILPLIIGCIANYVLCKKTKLTTKANFINSIAASTFFTGLIVLFQGKFIGDEVITKMIANTESILQASGNMSINIETGGPGSILMIYVIYIFSMYIIGNFANKDNNNNKPYAQV